MYLLRRKISPYSGYDQLLDIVRSFEVATKLKRQYVERGLKKDTWSKQAYHEVNLEKDLIVEDVSAFFKREISQDRSFFFVCHLEDYLGLSSLKIQKNFDAKEVAEGYITNFYKYCDLLEMSKHPEDFEPEEIEAYSIEKLYERLDLQKADEYFENWGGELKVYEVPEQMFQEEEEILADDVSLEASPQKVHETIFEKIVRYFKKKK